MRTLSKLITLLLCLELIVAPIQPELSLVATKAFAEDCPAGMQFDSTLNRCLTSAQTAKVMNLTASCPQGDVECYKTNAQNAFQEKVNAGEAPERVADKGGLINTVGKAAAIAVPLALAVGGIKGMNSTCGSSSLYAMIAGSAALFIGDTLANMQHKGRLKKIKESWGEIVNPEQANGDKDKERETSIEAQSMAFEKLAEAEDSMAKAAKMKKTFNMIAALAYTASAAMAVMEHFKWTAAQSNPPAQAAANQLYICQTNATGGEVEGTVPASGQYDNKQLDYLFKKDDTLLDELKYGKQFAFNVQSSKDYSALVINQRAYNLKNSSPSMDEFSEIRNFAENLGFLNEEKELLLTLSKGMWNAINPFPSAHARMELVKADEDAGTAGSTSNSSSSNSTANVDTNAAKAFKEDEGKGFDFMGLGIGAAAGFAAGKFLLKNKAVMPLGRAAMAGLLAGWAFIMMKHAGKQAEASEKRAELLRKMKEEFNTAAGAVYACKSEDRNNPGMPNCYCYTAENQRNPNRGNSQVCQNLWAGKPIGSTNYLTQGNTSTRICINNQQKADPTCACKQTKTCMKAGMAGITGLNPGTMSVLSSSLAPLNGIANGSVDAANINSAALENQAARARKLLDNLENSKAGKKIKAAKNKEAKKIESGLMTAARGINPAPALASSSSSFPSNPGDAARMLENELAANIPTGIGGGAGTLAAPANQAPEQAFDFGLTQDQLAAQETQIAELMKENLDYGANDINQGSNTNIFEVLSNRYQRSGMRRLFDEEGKTKADAPAKSDIVQ